LRRIKRFAASRVHLRRVLLVRMDWSEPWYSMDSAFGLSIPVARISISVASQWAQALFGNRKAQSRHFPNKQGEELGEVSGCSALF